MQTFSGSFLYCAQLKILNDFIYAVVLTTTDLLTEVNEFNTLQKAVFWVIY